MQTTVRHEAELESDPLWHVQPVQFVVQECRQTTVKLPRVADYSGGDVEHSLQFIHDRLRHNSYRAIYVRRPSALTTVT